MRFAAISRPRLPVALGTALCSIAASHPGSGGDARADSVDVEALFRSIEVRDRAMLPVHLPFSVWRTPGDPDGSMDPAAEGGEETLRGWVWWDGESIVAEVETLENGAPTVATSIQAEPGESRALMRRLGPQDESHWPGVRIVEAGIPSQLDASAPLNYGLGYLFATLPEVRRISSAPVLRGREPVLGRGCLRVGLLYGGASGTGKSIPLDLWIDDRETLLVLRAETYVPLEQAEASGVYTAEDRGSLVRERDGIPVLPHMRWDVLGVERTGGGWLPTIGRLTVAGSLVPPGARVTRIDVSGAELRAARPEVSVDLPTGGVHFDYLRDETYVVGQHDAALSRQQFDYWQLLRALGKVREGTTLGVDFAQLDFARSTCGANAALLMSHLQGRWCTIDGLFEGAAVARPEDGYNSLAEIERMLTRQGLHARAVETDLKGLESWGNDVIAHTLAREAGRPQGEPEEHFLVAGVRTSQRGLAVRYVSPPGKLQWATPEQFEEIWTGKALLVSEDPERLERFLREHERDGRRVWFGFALAALGLMFFGYQRLKLAASRRSGHAR